MLRLLLLLLSLPAAADVGLSRLAGELGALSAEAPAQAPKVKGVAVRFPSWELGAARNVELAAGPAVRLPEADIEHARTIFGDSLDYDAVRLVVARDGLAEFSQVWGETIRVGTSGLSRAKLMHELTHVWQYQTSGLGYISDSLGAQACAFVADLDRGGAYAYSADPKKSFFDYSAEQQAKIVEHFSASAELRRTEHYGRWMRELRSRRFVRGGRKVLFEEQAAGLKPRQYDVPALQGFEAPRVGPGVPQLEVRF